MRPNKESEALVSSEYAHECFKYDPITGVLTWRERPMCHFRTARGSAIANSQCAGKRAGTISKGYRIVRLKDKLFRAHRVIFLMQTGEWPDEDIDHIDRDRDNNAWDNLRAVSRSENHMNRGLIQHGSANPSQIKGVCFIKSGNYTNRWLARKVCIKADTAGRHIGMFPTATEAGYAVVQDLRNRGLDREAAEILEMVERVEV